MSETALPVLLSRLDFAWITTLHILYPPLTIGLSAMLFVGEALWLWRGDERWYRLCRFFERLFIINFAAGVATGITMEMAFGILYGPFSQAVGPFFGQVLGYETITAFMYEAGFIGLMIFGWGKIGRKMHLFALKNRHAALFRRGVRWSILALLFAAGLQIYLGDGIGLVVAQKQPAVLAAMEGHWNTYRQDGTVNTDWNLLAWPNAANNGNAFAIKIPHVLSLLETHTWSGKVQGLNDFKPDERPDMVVPVYGFRVMVGCAFAVFALALWGTALFFRKRLTVLKARLLLGKTIASCMSKRKAHRRVYPCLLCSLL